MSFAATVLHRTIHAANADATKFAVELARLLSQPYIKEYLIAIPPDNYTFTLILEMLLKKINVRLAFEMLQIATNRDPARLPYYLSHEKPDIKLKQLGSLPPIPRPMKKDLTMNADELPNMIPEYNAKRKEILNTFRALTKTLSTKADEMKQPAMPNALILKIYDMALGHDDHLDWPVSRKQLLSTAGVKKPNA